MTLCSLSGCLTNWTKPKAVKNRWDDEILPKVLEAAFEDLKDRFILPALQQWRNTSLYSGEFCTAGS